MYQQKKKMCSFCELFLRKSSRDAHRAVRTADCVHITIGATVLLVATAVPATVAVGALESAILVLAWPAHGRAARLLVDWGVALAVLADDVLVRISSRADQHLVLVHHHLEQARSDDGWSILDSEFCIFFLRK